MHLKSVPYILSWIKHQSEQRVRKQNTEIQSWDNVESGKSALGLSCMNYAKAWCSKLNTLHFLYVNLKLCRCIFFILLWILMTKTPNSPQALQCWKKMFLDSIRTLLAGPLNITLNLYFCSVFFTICCSGTENVHESIVCCQCPVNL